MQIQAKWLSPQSPSRQALNLIRNADFDAYFVGGCVRDTILGMAITDIDIATNALPQQVMQLAAAANIKAVAKNLAHGTVALIIQNKKFEVTTYRRDIATDGRYAVVDFCSSIKQDALRRDFTINALYADADGFIIDPLAALADLLMRRVRFINNPLTRISEDALRILRFFRFSALYLPNGRALDNKGMKACTYAAADIKKISKERIGTEMSKLLGVDNPVNSIIAMQQANILPLVLPAVNTSFLKALIVGEQQAQIKPDWIRRLCILGGYDTVNALRLNRAQARKLFKLSAAIKETSDLASLGYYYGEKIAISAALIWAAKNNTTVSQQIIQQLQTAARAIFPIKSYMLQPKYCGKDLGKQLKKREKGWVDSGFKKTAQNLLDDI